MPLEWASVIRLFSYFFLVVLSISGIPRIRPHARWMQARYLQADSGTGARLTLALLGLCASSTVVVTSKFYEYIPEVPAVLAGLSSVLVGVALARGGSGRLEIILRHLGLVAGAASATYYFLGAPHFVDGTWPRLILPALAPLAGIWAWVAVRVPWGVLFLAPMGSLEVVFPESRLAGMLVAAAIFTAIGVMAVKELSTVPRPQAWGAGAAWFLAGWTVFLLAPPLIPLAAILVLGALLAHPTVSRADQLTGRFSLLAASALGGYALGPSVPGGTIAPYYWMTVLVAATIAIRADFLGRNRFRIACQSVFAFGTGLLLPRLMNQTQVWVATVFVAYAAWLWIVLRASSNWRRRLLYAGFAASLLLAFAGSLAVHAFGSVNPPSDVYLVATLAALFAACLVARGARPWFAATLPMLIVVSLPKAIWELLGPDAIAAAWAVAAICTGFILGSWVLPRIARDGPRPYEALGVAATGLGIAWIARFPPSVGLHVLGAAALCGLAAAAVWRRAPRYLYAPGFVAFLATLPLLIAYGSFALALWAVVLGALVLGTFFVLDKGKGPIAATVLTTAGVGGAALLLHGNPLEGFLGMTNPSRALLVGGFAAVAISSAANYRAFRLQRLEPADLRMFSLERNAIPKVCCICRDEPTRHCLHCGVYYCGTHRLRRCRNPSCLASVENVVPYDVGAIFDIETAVVTAPDDAGPPASNRGRRSSPIGPPIEITHTVRCNIDRREIEEGGYCVNENIYFCSDRGHANQPCPDCNRNLRQFRRRAPA